MTTKIWILKYSFSSFDGEHEVLKAVFFVKPDALRLSLITKCEPKEVLELLETSQCLDSEYPDVITWNLNEYDNSKDYYIKKDIPINEALVLKLSSEIGGVEEEEQDVENYGVLVNTDYTKIQYIHKYDRDFK